MKKLSSVASFQNQIEVSSAESGASTRDDRFNIGELLLLLVWLLLAVLTFLSFQIDQLRILVKRKFSRSRLEPILVPAPAPDLRHCDRSRAPVSCAASDFPRPPDDATTI